MKSSEEVKTNKNGFTPKTNIYDSSEHNYSLSKKALQSTSVSNINDTVNRIFIFHFLK
jgi:hypothetical protein